MPLLFAINDILTLKKPHACGTNAWRVYRLGADIGLRCSKCDRLIMLPRSKVERRVRLIEREGKKLKPHQLNAQDQP